MGRVFKKKATSKRPALEKEQEEEEVAKKVKKVEKEPTPEPEEEPEEPEDVDDEEEDVDDEEEDVDDEQDEEEGEEEDVIDFDFEAYPPSEDDRDGIVNMLTQTFLRTDIDLKAMADGIIEKAPHGVVLTQAYDDEQTEEDFMVYGLCTTLPLNEKKDDAPKYIKDVFAYLLNRAKKGAPSEIYKRIEEIQEKGDGKTGLFVNERLLNFPSIVVPQVFGSVRTDIAGFQKQYSTVIYIQKLRIAEGAETGGSASSGAGSSGKKKGKAEKKRAAAAALANAQIEFDNPEDRVLFELKEGVETHFDYPVHMDVEPGSKFHITEKEGKKWNPFRRLVIMDAVRFDAFLKKGSEGVIV